VCSLGKVFRIARRFDRSVSCGCISFHRFFHLPQ
jgi:hypothetical protein